VPGARHFSELVIWQLADQVRVAVFKLTAKPDFSRDFRAKSQAEDAANSVCRNIAEGFGCEHLEFARFLVISRRSLNELQDILRGAQLKGYIVPSDIVPIGVLMRRLYPALSGMLTHLRRTADSKKKPEPRSEKRDGADPGRRSRTDRTDQR
jgi:four helix bundle protein